jgi:hypothetical protein
VKPLPEKIVVERQITIDKLKIKEGSPEEIWKHCLFSSEEYFEKRKNEAEAHKKVYKREFNNMPEEIIIPKLIFNEQELKMWGSGRGAIYVNEIPNITAEDL